MRQDNLSYRLSRRPFHSLRAVPRAYVAKFTRSTSAALFGPSRRSSRPFAFLTAVNAGGRRAFFVGPIRVTVFHRPCARSCRTGQSRLLKPVSYPAAVGNLRCLRILLFNRLNDFLHPTKKELFFSAHKGYLFSQLKHVYFSADKSILYARRVYSFCSERECYKESQASILKSVRCFASSARFTGSLCFLNLLFLLVAILKGKKKLDFVDQL